MYKVHINNYKYCVVVIYKSLSSTSKQLITFGNIAFCFCRQSIRFGEQTYRFDMMGKHHSIFEC